MGGFPSKISCLSKKHSASRSTSDRSTPPSSHYSPPLPTPDENAPPPPMSLEGESPEEEEPHRNPKPPGHPAWPARADPKTPRPRPVKKPAVATENSIGFPPVTTFRSKHKVGNPNSPYKSLLKKYNERRGIKVGAKKVWEWKGKSRSVAIRKGKMKGKGKERGKLENTALLRKYPPTDVTQI